MPRKPTPPNGEKPRAKRGTKPLTLGQCLDAAERERQRTLQRASEANARHAKEIDALQDRQLRELADEETRLGERLEKLIARVPEADRARARELCGVQEPVEVDRDPPPVVTHREVNTDWLNGQPAPASVAVEIDHATKTTRRVGAERT